ncbi:hypothetical protein CCR98_13790 [Stenotrophomonas sp. WZN-1]|uniref:hypothetical protein n=1 Tax=unclassified Stenotrophomonas TaxID=196198 RepID=UPI000B43D103|nr:MULTISPECIES: hypothetical protein [unclassified Stenotrophomonas]ARZ75196.1 hypothetical protein CCR98_13790 [Stenotrophomonas sp. WZN-1]
MTPHRSIMAGIVLALAGCSTPASYEGAGFSASSQCRMQCQASHRSCMAQGSTGNSAFSCEQQVVPAPDKRCKDVANPELRRACELKAHDCTMRAPMMSCGERRDTCMSSCG